MKTSIKCIKRDIKFWFQRRIKGWSDDETWNLDYEFIKWVNSRFKQYKKDASKIVNLEYHKFTYKKQEYTQLEMIDRIIALTDDILEKDFLTLDKKECKARIKQVNEIFDVFKLIYWTMWW